MILKFACTVWLSNKTPNNIACKGDNYGSCVIDLDIIPAECGHFWTASQIARFIDADSPRSAGDQRPPSKHGTSIYFAKRSRWTTHHISGWQKKTKLFNHPHIQQQFSQLISIFENIPLQLKRNPKKILWNFKSNLVKFF